MNKRIKKQFWLLPQEVAELKRKAELAGISETAVIRLLIRGYEPREKPDERFYTAMRNLSAIGNNMKTEALRWHSFQADIEAEFLRSAKSNLKWK